MQAQGSRRGKEFQCLELVTAIASSAFHECVLLTNKFSRFFRTLFEILSSLTDCRVVCLVNAPSYQVFGLKIIRLEQLLVSAFYFRFWLSALYGVQKSIIARRPFILVFQTPWFRLLSLSSAFRRRKILRVDSGMLKYVFSCLIDELRKRQFQ